MSYEQCVLERQGELRNIQLVREVPFNPLCICWKPLATVTHLAYVMCIGLLCYLEQRIYSSMIVGWC